MHSSFLLLILAPISPPCPPPHPPVPLPPNTQLGMLYKMHLFGELHRGALHVPPDLRRSHHRRAFLDYLLVTPLDRAVSPVQSDRLFSDQHNRVDRQSTSRGTRQRANQARQIDARCTPPCRQNLSGCYSLHRAASHYHYENLSPPRWALYPFLAYRCRTPY